MAEHLTADLLTGHFRRAPGYSGVRPGGTDDWLMFLTIEGCGRIGLPGREPLFQRRGDCLLYRPQTPHDYAPAVPPGLWDFHWAHFHPRAHWHDWLGWPELAPGIVGLHLTDEALVEQLAERFNDCHRHALEGGRRGIALGQVIIEEILVRLDAANPQAADAGVDPRVRAALAYCARNLTLALPLATVARHAGLSVSRLAHLVREQTGRSVQQHIESLRLQRARELLLRSTLSVAAIGEEVGFADPFYFSTRFRRAVGQSPVRFRAAQRP